MNRAEILHEAERCICSDRQNEYGTPENSFQAIANFWNTYLGERVDKITSGDVAIMMALMKVARIQTGRYKADSYTDACGYLAIAGEIEKQG